MYRLGLYLNRTLCDVLEEMRKLDETKNYNALAGLIEEAQSMGNRMEAKLGDVNDLKRVREESKRLGKEIRKREKKLKKLKRRQNEH